MEVIEYRPRDKRLVKLALYESQKEEKEHPLAVISNGFGGSVKSYAYLAKDLALLGYRVVVVEHEGSNLEVLHRLAKLPGERMEKVWKIVIDPEENQLRLQDLEATQVFLKERGWWNEKASLTLIGHSFGSHSMLSSLAQGMWEHPEIKLVLMSVAPPGCLLSVQDFAKVKVPSLHLTGTCDESLKFEPKDRCLVFEALKGCPRVAQLVFKEYQHMDFAGIGLKVLPKTDRLKQAVRAFLEPSKDGLKEFAKRYQDEIDDFKERE